LLSWTGANAKRQTDHAHQRGTLQKEFTIPGGASSEHTREENSTCGCVKKFWRRGNLSDKGLIGGGRAGKKRQFTSKDRGVMDCWLKLRKTAQGRNWNPEETLTQEIEFRAMTVPRRLKGFNQVVVSKGGGEDFVGGKWGDRQYK